MNQYQMSNMQSAIFRDSFAYLVNKNEEKIACSSNFEGEFLFGEYAEFVFSVGKDLSLSHECCFLALELFNKFMPAHLSYIQDNVGHLLIRASETQESRRKFLNDYFCNVENQVALRIMSCVQLASKTVLINRCVTPVDVKITLSKMTHANFSLKSICDSEIRVWKALGHSTSLPTPFGFLDILVEFLIMINQSEESREKIHYALKIRLFKLACHLLRFFYIIRPFFYLNIYRKATLFEHVRPKDKQAIARMASDHLLLASGIIALASFLVFGADFHSKVVNQLQILTSFAEEDITDFVLVFGRILTFGDVEAIRQELIPSLTQLK